MKNKKEIALITGASSGLGREFTLQVSKYFQLDEIWLISRRLERLQQIQDIFQEKKVRIFALDLFEHESINKIDKELEASNVSIKCLINNAGLGKIGAFDQHELADAQNMIRLNISSLVELTKICLKYMERESFIMQVASAIAFSPSPYFSVYAASKSFVLSFSLGITYELREKGIHCMAFCPGPIDTELFEVAIESKRENRFNSFLKTDIERAVKNALRCMKKKKDVAYGSMKIAICVYIAHLLPRAIVLKVLAGRKKLI